MKQLAPNLASPGDHYEALHTSPHGSVIVWEQRTSGNLWHKIQPDQSPDATRSFLHTLSGNADTYFTVNEFYGWRLQRLLKSLRANFVDVDLGREPTFQDLDDALAILREKRMPWPNLVIFSGRGLHLYWTIRHTPANALPVWQATERALIDALRDFNSDPKACDCTRLLRVAGTLNSKNGVEVRGLVLDGCPWAFHQLVDEVLGHRPQKAKIKIRSLDAARVKRGVHPKATIYRRWHLVLQDLHQIGRYHTVIPPGHRNEFLFLSSVALSWFAAPESIEDEVVDMAKLYCPEIEETESVQAASQSIARAKCAAGGEKQMWGGNEIDPRYHFKRLTLWELMEDLAKPIKSKLRAIISDELAAERKQERDNARWDDHYTGRGHKAGHAKSVAQAATMRAQGLTQQAISAELGVSKMTVSRWLKSL